MTAAGPAGWAGITGALRVVGGRSSLFLAEGRPYCATCGGGPTLEEELALRGEVGRGRWQDAARRAPEAVGEELVRTGTLTRRALREVLYGRVVRVAFELVRTNGRADVVDGECHPVGPVCTFELGEVLSEARRQVEQLTDVARVVPSVGLVPTLAPRLDDRHVEARLDREAWEVVAALGAGRSVADVARALGRSQLSVARLLVPLVRDGLVLLRAPSTPHGTGAGADGPPC
ncbi:MAG: hypothetical protein H0U89_03255 [Acidimicrobiia bacterium]|nr:hypothetical protein [Acidimicrobiia bacterium]